MATASLGGAFGSIPLTMWLMCLPPCWCPPIVCEQPANLGYYWLHGECLVLNLASKCGEGRSSQGFCAAVCSVTCLAEQEGTTAFLYQLLSRWTGISPLPLTCQPRSGLSCSPFWFCSPLKLAWPLRQKTSPHLYAVVHGMGIVPALKYKLQAFAGSDSDRAGKGGRATPSCLFHKVGFRLQSPFPHHTTVLNLGKMTSW